MVEVEGARGLVHRSELSWMSSPSPTAFAKLGDEFEVLVLDVNKSKRRIGLSIRQCVPNPLDAIEVGAVYQGTVSKIVDYGVFVVLEDSGLTGLVHLSQLTEMAGYRPEQLVTRGDSLVVKVLSIDPKKHRVSLSVTQAMLL
jgi:ribosomal protein S1